MLVNLIKISSILNYYLYNIYLVHCNSLFITTSHLHISAGCFITFHSYIFFFFYCHGDDHRIVGFVGNLYIFSFLISLTDISSLDGLTLILKIMCQCDIKHFMMYQIKTIISVLKVLIYVITCITAHPFRLAVFLVINYISTFTTAVILYLHLPMQ